MTYLKEPSKHIHTVVADKQWWTETPLICPICRDTAVVTIEIEGGPLCKQLDIPCSVDPIPEISRRLDENPDVPEWARNRKPVEFHPGEPNILLLIPGPLNCVHNPSIKHNSNIAGVKNAVHIDGNFLSPERSIKLCNHSPDGFSWGYHGSGPAQLALALLLEAGASDKEAQRYHQEFKRDKISTLEKFAFHLKGSAVLDWLAGCRAADRLQHR